MFNKFWKNILWYLIIILYCCFTLFNSTVVYGWGQLTHTIIGMETQTGPGYNNVPDYWKSWELSPFPEISPYFLWSHECKVTNGRRSKPEYNKNIPDKINYYAMDDSPSRYFDILKGKMKGVAVSIPKLISGWKAHNAADQAVHYELFPFPGDIIPPQMHEIYEDAADMLVYVKELFNGVADDAFDSNGDPIGFPLQSSPSIECGDDFTDAFLLLSEKEFRKKQATLDIREGNMWGLKVQQLSEIAELRHKMESKLLNELFVFDNINIVFEFNRSGYDYVIDEYTSQGRPLEYWFKYYKDAIKAVNDIPKP